MAGGLGVVADMDKLLLHPEVDTFARQCTILSKLKLCIALAYSYRWLSLRYFRSAMHNFKQA